MSDNQATSIGDPGAWKSRVGEEMRKKAEKQDKTPDVAKPEKPAVTVDKEITVGEKLNTNALFFMSDGSVRWKA